MSKGICSPPPSGPMRSMRLLWMARCYGYGSDAQSYFFRYSVCTRLASLDLDDLDRGARLGHVLAPGAHGLEMQPDRLPDPALDHSPRSTGGDAAGQVRNVRGPVVGSLLVDDGVLHLRSSLSPACRRILRHAPGGRPSLGGPATVTVPGRLGCWNCRWLPVRRTSSTTATT